MLEYIGYAFIGGFFMISIVNTYFFVRSFFMHRSIRKQQDEIAIQIAKTHYLVSSLSVLGEKNEDLKDELIQVTEECYENTYRLLEIRFNDVEHYLSEINTSIGNIEVPAIKSSRVMITSRRRNRRKKEIEFKKGE